MVAVDPRTAGLLETSEEVSKKYVEQAASLPVQWHYAAVKLLGDCDLNYRTATSKRLLVEVTLIRLCQLLKPATPLLTRSTAPCRWAIPRKSAKRPRRHNSRRNLPNRPSRCRHRNQHNLPSQRNLHTYHNRRNNHHVSHNRSNRNLPSLLAQGPQTDHPPLGFQIQRKTRRPLQGALSIAPTPFPTNNSCRHGRNS